MADDIRVNGNQMSWGSIVLKLAKERYTGCSSVTYGDKRERVKSYGMGRHQAPRGRSRGKYSTDPVKLKFPKGSAQAFRAFLATAAVDGVSIGDVEFDINVQFFDTGEIPMDVLIERCVLIEDTSGHEEGADPLFDEMSFDCMLIRRNGLTLFDSASGTP